MMTKNLLFHSFGKNKKADPFYNLSIFSFKNLILNLSKAINPSEYVITFDDGYKTIKPAIEYACKLGFNTTAYIVTNKINKKGFLSDKDIFDLFLNGTKIGSHSHSHNDLTKLNIERLSFELRESKKILSKIISHEVKDFSLPYGEYNKLVINEARKYYSKIAISRPLIQKSNYIVGRLSIHKSNYKNIKFISSILKNKYNLKFIFKLILVSLLKKITPISFYRKFKSYFLNKKTINFF